jgi:predicted unusual protein kinase regulating ubiquinone biosynthesis (AarF/ABC1/UbiB family)
VADVSLAEVFKGIVQMMDGFGVESPQELVLVTKQLLYFERYARELAPDYVILSDPSILWHLLG